jgi:hypothetical protein
MIITNNKMKIYKLTLALILCTVLFSCNTSQKESTTLDKKEAVTENPEVNADFSEINTDSIVRYIDNQRIFIEKNIGEAVVVTTDLLREKIKQKWKKIDFYAMDGKLVRIKTYPYEQITNRTEEFYLHNENLILVAIEDKGDTERGKSKDEFDKLYYFNDGELIEEYNPAGEPEYSLRKSDGEELVAEFKEYLEIYASLQKK